MKLNYLLLALSLLPPLAAGLEEGDLATHIYADSEGATGLFLMPWQRAESSDVDRPPSLLDAVPQQLDPEGFQRHFQWYQAQRAYRHWRLQRNNW